VFAPAGGRWPGRFVHQKVRGWELLLGLSLKESSIGFQRECLSNSQSVRNQYTLYEFKPLFTNSEQHSQVSEWKLAAPPIWGALVG
jgi:hypothetical protein